VEKVDIMYVNDNMQYKNSLVPRDRLDAEVRLP